MNSVEDYGEKWTKDTEVAIDYLNDALAQRELPVLLMALRRVAKNRVGGVRRLSEEMGMNRSSLNNALDARGNPTLKTALKILDQLGYKVTLASKSPD